MAKTSTNPTIPLSRYPFGLEETIFGPKKLRQRASSIKATMSSAPRKRGVKA